MRYNNKLDVLKDYEDRIYNISSDINILEDIKRLYKVDGGDYKSLMRNFNKSFNIKRSIWDNSISYIEVSGKGLKGEYKTVDIYFNDTDRLNKDEVSMIWNGIKRNIKRSKRLLKAYENNYNNLSDKMDTIDQLIKNFNEDIKGLTDFTDQYIIQSYIKDKIDIIRRF